MASDQHVDIEALRAQLSQFKVWHPGYGLFGNGIFSSTNRTILDDAIDELAALQQEREMLIHAIDEWRDRLVAITPQDLEAAWHVVNNAVTGEAEDRALFVLSDGIAELGRLRAWRDRAVPLLRALADVCQYTLRGDPSVLRCRYPLCSPWRKLGETTWRHSEACLVAQTRTLLAESEAHNAHP